MRILVVVAHPLEDSLCAHLARRTTICLEAVGASVDVLDLYRESFAPALTIEERQTYYGNFHTDGNGALLQARLAQADALVLVFPTWWYSMPAILKGWFDRVWSPGLAFANGTPIQPLLHNLKSCLVITTLGSPWWVDAFVMRRPVARVLKRAVLGTCAPQAQFRMLSLHSAEEANPKRVDAFLRRVAEASAKLAQR